MDNECFFTLNEKTTLPVPNYFLELKSNSSSQELQILLPFSANTSVEVLRYDKFLISSADTTNLEIGSYDYYVWESVSGNTQFSAVTNIVESGKVIVEGEISTGTTFYTDSTQIVYFD